MPFPAAGLEAAASRNRVLTPGGQDRLRIATMEWAARRIPRYSQQYLHKDPYGYCLIHATEVQRTRLVPTCLALRCNLLRSSIPSAVGAILSSVLVQRALFP